MRRSCCNPPGAIKAAWLAGLGLRRTVPRWQGRLMPNAPPRRPSPRSPSRKWMARANRGPASRACVQLLVALLLAGVAAQACGYRVVGGATPLGKKPLAVKPFVERGPVGLAGPLAAALGAELSEAGLQLVAQSEATPVLSGEIEAVRTRTSPIARLNAPIPAYEVDARVRVQLRDARGNTVWSARVRASGEFLQAPQDGGVDPTLATEANRERSLQRVAEQLATAIRRRLMVASTTPAHPPSRQSAAPSAHGGS